MKKRRYINISYNKHIKRLDMIHLLKNINWTITNLPYCPDVENNYVFSKEYIDITINKPIQLIFPIQRYGLNIIKLQIMYESHRKLTDQ